LHYTSAENDILLLQEIYNGVANNLIFLT